MSDPKPVVGQLQFEQRTPEGEKRIIIASNTAFRNPLYNYVTTTFGYSNGVSVQSYPPHWVFCPWKTRSGYDSTTWAIKHGYMGNTGDVNNYPGYSAATMGTFTYPKFRMQHTTLNFNQASQSRVIGAVGCNSYWFNEAGEDGVMSLTEIPLDVTTIGPIYVHPAYTSSVTVTTGQNWVQLTTGYWNGAYPWYAGKIDFVRIETGLDRGMYRVSSQGTANGKLFLNHLDGTPFVGQSTGSVVATFSHRRAFYNESGVIPSSLGAPYTTVTGKFNPGDLRNSYQLRVIFEKNGTTTAGDQQGSYYFTLKPYTHNDSDWISGSTLPGGLNNNTLMFITGSTWYWMNMWGYYFDAGGNGTALIANTGACNGAVYDQPTNRLWFILEAASSAGSSLCYWNYKTMEGWREVADSLNTPVNSGELTPAVTTAKVLRSLDIGSDGTVYMTGYHATAGLGGLTVIHRDLSTQQWTTSSGTPNFFPYSTPQAGVVDRSRYRTGTTGNVVTDAAANTLNSTGAAFTNADIGRAIKVVGATNDNGTYKISVVNSATQVVVTTMTDALVTFTGGTGGTFSIGDRIYFFTATAPGYTANKLLYMESLAPGYFMDRSVTMTNARQYYGIPLIGCPQKAVVDQRNGNLYWTSTDVQHQINQYNPLTNAHAYKTLADFATPPGSPTGTVDAPTLFYQLALNTMFDELWVGCYWGHIRIDLSNFSSSTLWRRYTGQDDATAYYQNPANVYHRDGSNSATNYLVMSVMNYFAGPDGKMYCTLIRPDNSGYESMAVFNRETDSWQPCTINGSGMGGGLSGYAAFMTSCTNDGYAVGIWPYDMLTYSGNRGGLYPLEIDYQWIGGVWTPKQVVRDSLPNFDTSDTITPGLKAKPLHTTTDDLIYGTKITFTPQGGATPPNNEFLGRAGVVKPTAVAAVRSDGATHAGPSPAANVFTGTSFQATDATKYLRIHNGANAGVYIIQSYTDVNNVVLQKLNGAAFVGAGAGSLTYSVWDMGLAGTNAGIENITCLLADGVSKDSSQDLNGFNYEFFAQKTVLSEQVEPIKCCVKNYGPPGSVGVTVGHLNLGPTTANWYPAEGAHRGFEATVTNGDALLDGLIDKILYGTTGNASATQPLVTATANNWYGTTCDAGVLGYQTCIDFGAAVEVGSVLMRFYGNQGNTPSYSMSCNTHGGTLGMMYNTNTTPAASTAVRIPVGASTLGFVLNTTTLTLSAGDFLGPIVGAPMVNGAIAQDANTFTATVAPGTFTGYEGYILKVTAGAAAGDLGSYRIVSVNGGGDIATIRNLDQTAKTWTATASGITYEIRDGVQEEDRICSPSLAVGSHRFVIERLLTPTTAQARIGARSTLSTQAWEVIKPTWSVVKRLAFQAVAQGSSPPEVYSNNTWMSGDGQERYDHSSFKVFMDFSDLSSGKRTARYWKWAAMTRFAGATGAHRDWLCSFEFYTPAGKLIGATPYNRLDTVDSEPNFIFAHVNRMDFIQVTSTTMGTGYNGNVSLGGGLGNTVTLVTGGNKFLGYQVRPSITDGVADNLANTFNSATAVFDNSDTGRFIKLITAPTNGGTYPYLRITSVVGPTQVIVATPAGNTVTFAAESGIVFSLHEGINGGISTPDYINFGAVNSGQEYSISSINDALTTITLNTTYLSPLTNVAFEIRRRALDYNTATPTPSASYTARIIHHELTTGSYPQQPGDICCDSRGFLRFYDNDIGNGNMRSDGKTYSGGGSFDGTFVYDDVGRLLHIQTGADIGLYKISAWNSATNVTVVNAYTGAAVSFTTTSGATLQYHIYGEKRFRASRYLTGLRA